MNGIDKIVGKIREESAKEAAAIINEAVARAEDIKKESNRRAQEKYWEAVKVGATKLAEFRERCAAAASDDAEKTLAKRREMYMDMAFQSAKQKVLSMPAEEYGNFLGRKAAAACVSGEEKILLSHEDKKRCGETVCKKANEELRRLGKNGCLSLSEETRETGGGFILIWDGGEKDMRLDTLLVELREEILEEAEETLFGKV